MAAETVKSTLEPLVLQEDEIFLRMGDRISLFSVEGNGYLTTDGFMEKICKLYYSNVSKHTDFLDCIFELYPKYKYDASKVHQDLLERYARKKDYRHAKIGVSHELTEDEEQQLELSHQNALAEKRENHTEFQRVSGKNINYGDVVQLMHVKSGKFLSIISKEVAELGKECLKVSLDQTGGEGSWFHVTPRFKLRSEGEPVNTGDQILLTSKKYNYLYLHLTQQQVTVNNHLVYKTEVNASSHFSSWRVIPYASIKHSNNYIKVGDVIRMYHKEAEGQVVNEKRITLLEHKAESEDTYSSGSDSDSRRSSSGSSSFSSSSVTGEDESDDIKEEEPINEDLINVTEEVFLQKVDLTESTRGNSNALWLIEFENSMRGGVVYYNRLYRFKHVATGKYLSAFVDSDEPLKDEISPKVVSPGDKKVQFKVESIPNSSCLFSIAPINREQESRGDAVEINSYLRLRHHKTQRWIHVESNESGNNNSYDREVSGSGTSPVRHSGMGPGGNPVADPEETSNNKLSSNHMNLVGSTVCYDSDAFSFIPAEPAELLALLKVRGKISSLSNFAHAVASVNRLTHHSSINSSHGHHHHGGHHSGHHSSHEGGHHHHSGHHSSHEGGHHHGGHHSGHHSSHEGGHEGLHRSSHEGGHHHHHHGHHSGHHSGREEGHDEHVGRSSHHDEEPSHLKKRSASGMRHSHSHHHSLPVALKTVAFVKKILTSLNHHCHNRAMQDLLREQNIIDVVIEMLRGLFETNKFRLEDIAQPENHSILEICCLAYQLLTLMLNENAINRQITTKYLPLIKSHIGYGMKTTSTLMQLMKNNNYLAQLPYQEISYFINLAKTKRMKPKYIQLLATLCSLNGKALPRNQKHIVRELSLEKSDWFIPMKVLENKFVLEYEGKWLELSEFAETVPPKVLSYFIETMELYAKLCLGGNLYVGAIMARRLTVKSILQTLQDSKLNFELRAALLDFVLNFYVALKQPKPATFIIETRLWSDVDMDLKDLAKKQKVTLAVGEDREREGRPRKFSKGKSRDGSRSRNARPTSMSRKRGLKSRPRSNKTIITEDTENKTETTTEDKKIETITEENENKTEIPKEITIEDLSNEYKSETMEDKKNKTEEIGEGVKPNVSAPVMIEGIAVFKPDGSLINSDELDVATSPSELAGYVDSPQRKGRAANLFVEEDFRVLNQFLLGYLHNLHEKLSTYTPSNARVTILEGIKLTHSVVNLCFNMLSFGKFSTDDVRELLPLVASILFDMKKANETFKTIEENEYEEEDTEDSHEILDTKLVMCKILAIFYDYRLNLRLTKLLVILKNNSEGNNNGNEMKLSEEEKTEVVSVLKMFDLDQEQWIPTLIDLIIRAKYHPELAIASASLLVKSYRQREELLQALSNVQILTEERLVHIYQLVTKATEGLRKMMLSSQFPSHIQSVIAVVNQLAGICVTDNGPNHQTQQIFLNLGTHDTIIELMQIEHELKDTLMPHCFELLIKSCADNHEAQTKLHHSLDYFIQELGSPIWNAKAARLIAEIFKNNYALCSQITEYRIRRMIDFISNTKSSNFIDILQALVEVNQRPLRRNQVLIMKLVFEKRDVLFHIYDPSFKQRKKVAPKNLFWATIPLPSTLKDFNQFTYLNPDHELVFLFKILQLISTCCKLKIYEAEIKVQSVFPLEYVLTEVIEKDNIFFLRGSYLTLLYEAYVEMERKLKNIVDYLESKIGEVLDSLTFEIKEYIASSKLHPPLTEVPTDIALQRDWICRIERENFIFEAVLPFVKNFFEKGISDGKHENLTPSISKLLDNIYELSSLPGLTSTQMFAVGSAVTEILNRKIIEIHIRTEIMKIVNDHRNFSSQEEEKRNADLLKSKTTDRVTLLLCQYEKTVKDVFDPKQEVSGLIKVLKNSVLVDEQYKELTARIAHILPLFDLEDHKDHVVTFLRAYYSLLREVHKSGDQEQLVSLQNKLTELYFLDIIPHVIVKSGDGSIVHWVFKIANQLLNGGNERVQTHLYNLLKAYNNREAFFLEIRDMLRRGVNELQERRSHYLKQLEHIIGHEKMTNGLSRISQEQMDLVKKQEHVKFYYAEGGSIRQVLRFLQLLCEGHNIVFQNHLRLQSNNILSYDLISETASYMEAVETEVDGSNVDIFIQLYATLTEYCQGPCTENQLVLVRTKLCEATNVILQMNSSLCSPSKMYELKLVAINFLLSLLEGNSDDFVAIHMLNVLDVNCIERNLFQVHQQLEKSNDKETCEGLEMAFASFILVKNLSHFDKAGKLDKVIKKLPPDSIFIRYTHSIEVFRKNILERVYFRVPTVCTLLSEESKKDLVYNVNRTTQQEKIQDFYARAEILIEEIELREKLAQNETLSFIVTKEQLFKDVSFAIALLINIVLVFDYDSETVYKLSFLSYWIVFLLGLASVAISAIIWFIHINTTTQIIIAQKWKEAFNEDYSKLQITTNKTKSLVVYFATYDSHFLYYMTYFLFAALGFLLLPNAPFFFSFLLLDLIARNEELQYVIRAITLNGKSLLYTSLLLIVVLYIYSVLGFLFFSDKFSNDGQPTCTSLFHCFVTIASDGFMSGGLKDLLEPAVWGEFRTAFRIFYVLSFFLLVIVILMNILFGIIIDTFGELRSKNQEIAEDVKNKCFVCAIPRESFDRHAEGFEKHVRDDHNLWNYLYFLVYLRRKDATEYTGLESFISEKIDEKDWSFMPHLQALVLSKPLGEEDQSATLAEKLIQLNKETKKKLDKILKGAQREFDQKTVVLEQKLETVVKMQEGLGEKLEVLIKLVTTGNQN